MRMLISRNIMFHLRSGEAALLRAAVGSSESLPSPGSSMNSYAGPAMSQDEEVTAARAMIIDFKDLETRLSQLITHLNLSAYDIESLDKLDLFFDFSSQLPDSVQLEMIEVFGSSGWSIKWIRDS